MDIIFHRGTTILKGVSDSSYAAELPGVLWDPRVKCWRAPAHRYAELVAELRARSVRHTDRIRAGARTAPRAGSRASSALRLRPYQEAALLSWELAGRRGIVVLPTGSGKTRLAIAAALRLGCRALFLVPTRVLVDQWLVNLERAGVRSPGCHGDGRRELRPLTVATFESGWRWMDRIGDRFDLLVVDEAHHFGHGARDEALEMAVAPARLGLTATPSEGAAAAISAELIGPVVFRLGIPDLAGSYLAPFDIMTISLDLGVRSVRSGVDLRPLLALSAHIGVRQGVGRDDPAARLASLVSAARQLRAAGRTGLLVSADRGAGVSGRGAESLRQQSGRALRQRLLSRHRRLGSGTRAEAGRGGGSASVPGFSVETSPRTRAAVAARDRGLLDSGLLGAEAGSLSSGEIAKPGSVYRRGSAMLRGRSSSGRSRREVSPAGAAGGCAGGREGRVRLRRGSRGARFQSAENSMFA